MYVYEVPRDAGLDLRSGGCLKKVYFVYLHGSYSTVPTSILLSKNNSNQFIGSCRFHYALKVFQYTG